MAWAAFNYDWDWEGAERGFRRAIELSPNHAPAHLWYSVVLASMGQHAEARRHIALARELDPLSRSVGQTAGMVLCLAREYDEAAEVLNELIEIDERDALARSTLGLVYAEQGRCHEAVSQFETVLDLAGKFPPIAANVKALIGYAYAAADKTAEARSLAEEVAGGQVSEPYWIAAIYAKLRENDRAFEWLERAVERRSTYLTGLKTAPVVDNLRSDSRFPGLLRQIGLER